MVLRDEDMSMETDGSWKRLNTLQHYGVVDGATFRLMKRQIHAPPGQCEQIVYYVLSGLVQSCIYSGCSVLSGDFSCEFKLNTVSGF